MQLPVTVHENVLPVSVGETVRDEPLGDGDPSIAYQSFDLKKSPLIYLVAAGSGRGYASTLEIRVGGVLWEERATFSGASPTDRLYTVRHDAPRPSGPSGHTTLGQAAEAPRSPT